MSTLPFESMQMPHPKLLGAAVALALVGISGAFYITPTNTKVYIYMAMHLLIFYLGMHYVYTCTHTYITYIMYMVVTTRFEWIETN
jgi:hypothetical protein